MCDVHEESMLVFDAQVLIMDLLVGRKQRVNVNLLVILVNLFVVSNTVAYYLLSITILFSSLWYSLFL